MRIAMISSHASPLGDVDTAGQSLHVAELSTALVDGGHEVTVYTRQDDPGQERVVATPHGYRVVHVPAGPARPVHRDEVLPHMAEFTSFVDDHWRTGRPDVVHSHFWTSGLVAAVVAKHHEVPVAHTYHTLGTVERHADAGPPERVRTERLVGRSAGRVIATSSYEVAELSRMGIPKERIGVVPGGVDCTRFVPDGPSARRRLPYRVVSVGSLVPRNGFADLIAVLPCLPDTELVIAGTGDSEADRELATRLGVDRRVRFVGPVSRAQLPELLRSADVVACVPWYEPFGNLPLEAMACGVPVLASAVGGIADAVVDGVTGVLVPPRRRAALTTALKTLLADPVKRSFLGAAGRDRVESRYPWPVIAEQTVRAYESCLNRSPLAGNLRQPLAR